MSLSYSFHTNNTYNKIIHTKPSKSLQEPFKQGKQWQRSQNGDKRSYEALNDSKGH